MEALRLARWILPLVLLWPAACGDEPEPAPEPGAAAQEPVAEVSGTAPLEEPQTVQPAAEGPLRATFRASYRERTLALVAEPLPEGGWSFVQHPESEWQVERAVLEDGTLRLELRLGSGLRAHVVRFEGRFEPAATALVGSLQDGVVASELALRRDA